VFEHSNLPLYLPAYGLDEEKDINEVINNLKGWGRMVIMNFEF